MKRRKLYLFAIFFSLLLSGCGSDSDDDVVTSGGSSNIGMCEQEAGTFDYPDGSSFELKPNCEFIVTLEDGSYGHGIINNITTNGSFSADFIIDTGPSQGTCATINGTPTSVNVSNIHQCN